METGLPPGPKVSSTRCPLVPNGPPIQTKLSKLHHSASEPSSRPEQRPEEEVCTTGFGPSFYHAAVAVSGMDQKHVRDVRCELDSHADAHHQVRDASQKEIRLETDDRAKQEVFT